ncbi:efflux RND transporter periplasmic adaptor subunit [Methylocystis bryophila]|uniref:Efflux transporter periplasmic adaptor subunit n=1 Tax=Methylocystis bryophila TaxID=655015 RepID=A0A1W6MT45_9HYPH|nr:efflux RND transporter periplasmic adaptor subunit [Methylocystis bryophila]ARN80764.1 efflux transporter periplasmic adaptor subunit [Methylocystis bryophila]BDV40843.1 drug-efflux protein [Methylocystis bryophila]
MARFKVLASKPRAAVAALCAGLVIVYFLSAWTSHAPPPKYSTAKIGKLDIEDTVLAAGVLQPIRQVDVGTRATGQLKSLKVNLGDHVREGDLLAEIDSLLQDNELRAQQANLANLEAKQRAAAARLRKARLELERQQGLIHGAATSRRDFESAEAEAQANEADLASLGAQIAQARSLVKTAEANLSYTRIIAPIDGEVVAILTKEGQTVVAAQIVPVILKLAKLDAMTVKTQISEADVVNIKVGQPVSFTIMGEPDKRYAARLRVVESAPSSYSEPPATQAAAQSSSPGTAVGAPVFYNALFDVPNRDGTLRIGMSAQVSIVQGVVKNALAIPYSALREQGPDGRFLVRVVGAKGKEPEERRVRVGVNNRSFAQVLDGLKEGEEVILGDLPTAGGSAT